MTPIRVLVVDDSAVARRLVAGALAADPQVELVGTASGGLEALALMDGLAPDVVVLDLEMPGLDGLGTLAALRRTHPRLPVIMFSVRTERGAVATVDALAAGATDYVAKPSAAGPETAVAAIRDGLLPKIHQLGRPAARAPMPAAAPGLRTGAPASPPRAPAPVELVVVAVSTGGPNALAALLPALPALPVPVVVVQHMPAMFTRLLAERLDKVASVPVAEGWAGAVAEPGQVWIAPGGMHVLVERDGPALRLDLDRGPPVNGCRPSADVLFASAVRAAGPGVLAVVLTGMGQDGLDGCRQVRAAGGRVLVQDRDSSVVWGMPGAVAGAGLADRVLPLADLAGALAASTASAHPRLRIG